MQVAGEHHDCPILVFVISEAERLEENLIPFAHLRRFGESIANRNPPANIICFIMIPRIISISFQHA